MILLIGSPNDNDLAAVAHCLRHRGEDFHIWDTTKPNALTGGIKLDSEGLHCPLYSSYMGDQTIQTSDVTACYWRWVQWTGDDNIDAMIRAILSHLSALVPVMINQMPVYARHKAKPFELSLLSRASSGGTIVVPATTWMLTQYRPFVEAEIKLAIQRRNRAVLVKPAQGGDEIFKFIHKKDVTDEVMNRIMKLGAITIQPYIKPSDSHYRVITVAEKTFVIRIESNEIDWRSDGRAKVFPVDGKIAREEFADFKSLSKKLGMVLAAYDLIIDSNGRRWLLEVNPSPMSATFALTTGLPIIEAICDVLMQVEDVSHVEEPEDSA